MTQSSPSAMRSVAAASPVLILVAVALIAMLTFGPRASSGFFLLPMSNTYGWGRDVFGLALALQNLLWGLGSPFAAPLPTASHGAGSVRRALIYASASR